MDNHRPNLMSHEIFVELDMLRGQGEDREWKEMSRWIKYEETLEEEAHRWGKPHVASLSFHSLIKLKDLIETGVMLFDLDEEDFVSICLRVVDELSDSGLIAPDCKDLVLKTLLLKHKHVDNEDHWKFDKSHHKMSGSTTSLQHKSSNEKTKASIITSKSSSALGKLLGGDDIDKEKSTMTGHETFDLRLPRRISEMDMRLMLSKDSLLRRIPQGAEASLVLVGMDDAIKTPCLAFVRLREAVLMHHITEVPLPVRFLFILFGPNDLDGDVDYKEIGRSISTLMSNTEFHEIAYSGLNRRDLMRGIHIFLNESIVIPPGDWDNELYPLDEFREKNKNIRERALKQMAKAQGLEGDEEKLPIEPETLLINPLERTRRVFGGLRNDVSRYKYYWNDIKDGMDNLQAYNAIIFIYFAAVAGAIAFGGLYYDKTESNIGISESLVATSIAGMLFALFSGQPLIIIGSTGPLLMFEESFYNFCRDYHINFLAMKFWIGIWLSVIALFASAIEIGVLAKYFTRFTQEIFSALISILFVFEALYNLYKIYRDHPLLPIDAYCVVNDTNGTNGHTGKLNQPNTALLSTILCFGTFVIAVSLSIGFRNSNYLNMRARKVIASSAVPLGLILMILLDNLIKYTKTEKLNVPMGFETSNSTLRGWIVDPFVLGQRGVFMSIIPAILVFIIVFLETSITELIMGKMPLQRGQGFHLDILLICLINTGIGIFGGPWVNAAILRTATHSTSLAVYSTNNPPGEKPRLIGVKEQRFTGFIISLMVGMSILMSEALALIPLAVIYGVFLYMGFSAIFGNQLFERFSLFFKQVRNHPQVPFVRRVRTWKMHLFTIIQIICISVLWIVKSTPAALAFPFFIILLVPFRLFGLKYIFSKVELSALDASETPLPTVEKKAE